MNPGIEQDLADPFDLRHLCGQRRQGVGGKVQRFTLRCKREVVFDGQVHAGLFRIILQMRNGRLEQVFESGAIHVRETGNRNKKPSAALQKLSQFLLFLPGGFDVLLIGIRVVSRQVLQLGGFRAQLRGNLVRCSCAGKEKKDGKSKQAKGNHPPNHQGQIFFKPAHGGSFIGCFNFSVTPKLNVIEFVASTCSMSPESFVSFLSNRGLDWSSSSTA